MNWYEGTLFNPATCPSLPIAYGESAFYDNGVFIGYLVPVGPMTLTQSWTTANTVELSDRTASLMTINSGATYTVNSIEIGKHYTNSTYVGSDGPATLHLDHGAVAGSIIVGGSGKGLLKTDGVASATTLTLARDAASSGTLTVNAGSTMTVTSGTNYGAGTTRINNAGTLNLGSTSGTLGTLNNSGTLSYRGSLTIGSISNSGNLSVVGSGSVGSSTLYTAANTTLSGGGTVTLTDPSYTTLYATQSSGTTFTNADNTIQGTGVVNVYGSFVNNGTVNANAAGKQLTLQSQGGIVTNGGTLTASNGGTLTISAPIGNSGGTVTSQTGSTVILNTGGLTGGTIGGGGSMLFKGGTLDNVSNSATVTVPGGGNGTIRNATSNAGAFVLAGSGSTGSSTLSIAGTTTLSGGGTVTLTDPSYATLYATQSSGDTLTNVDNTIQGTGVVNVYGSFVNSGTVNANTAGKALTLQSQGGTFTNHGTFTAANGGILRIPIVVANAGGTISAQPGSTTSLNNGTINGGTIAGTVTVTQGSGTVTGLINNVGNLAVVGSGSTGGATLYTSGNTTLSGGGTVTLTDPSYATFYATQSSGATFTNADNTVQGSGVVNVYGSFVNNGTVNANTAGKQLTIQSQGGSVTNGGILTAANGGTLTISAPVSNAAGTVTSQAGSMVVLQGGGLTGGTLGGSGAVSFKGGTLDNVANSATVTVPGGGNGTIRNATSNTGAFVLAGSGSTGSSTLSIAGMTTLSGGGTVTLTDPSYATLYATNSSSDVLTNADNTIQGTGVVNVYGSFVNNGTVNANAPGKLLTLQSQGGTFTNHGTFTASNGGILRIPVVVANAGGTVSGQAGSTLSLNSGTINGGTIAGTVTVAQGTGTVTGSINNIGTLAVVGSGSTGSATLNASGNTTLSGGGTVMLTDPSYATFYATQSSGATCTNADNTIQGTGHVYVYGSFVNNGTVNANAAGKELTIQSQGGTVANGGTLTASGGGTLNISAPVINTGIISARSATVRFTQVSIADGLDGSGTLVNTATIYGSGPLRGTDLTGLGSKLMLNRASATDPVTLVKSLLTAGYVTNFATGQLRSTGVTARTGLGYRDTGSNVTVMHTYNGDADVDGGVSINDFNALAGNFGKSSGQIWSGGDFDYDGGVSINDFNLLAANFGQSIASPADGPNAMAMSLWAFAIAHDDIADFVAATGVPEPVTMTVFAVGTILMLRRPGRRYETSQRRSRR